ncbi:MAG: sodium:solute symporter [Nitrospirales bacterium]|nr:sodium:solute symporter [Nitrospirales bacterium]
MLDVQLVPSGLQPLHAYLVFLGLAVLFIGIALVIRAIFVRSTHDFLVAGRRIGLGLGVSSVIASWTWAMAVMMSSAQAYTFGVSGLWWFTIPNGLAVIAVIPFGIYLRKHMPHGYTLSQYISVRFPGNKALYNVFIASMLFGCFIMALINLKGTSVVMSTIYGIDWRVVPIISGIVVIVYVSIGGMWNSAVTDTIQTFLITIPAAVVVVAVFEKVGGPGPVFDAISSSKPPEFLQWSDPKTAIAFGITLALGLLSNTVSDQTFWERIWAVKAKYVSRIFLWGGAWFYGIPICFGLLGLVGVAMGLDLKTMGGDAAAVGPFVVSHLGLSGWLVILYSIAIMAACISTLDSAFIGTSSVVSVDIVKRVNPHVSDKRLLRYTRLAVGIVGILSILVILTGVDFVTIVLVTYALKTSVLIPLILAVFWKKVSGKGVLWGIISSIVIGMPIYFAKGEFAGTLSILAISFVVPLVWTFVQPDEFDESFLQKLQDLRH